MGFNEVMELPYAVFLSLLKHTRILQLEETPEGQQLLSKSRLLSQTEPDWDRIRKSENYQRSSR